MVGCKANGITNFASVLLVMWALRSPLEIITVSSVEARRAALVIGDDRYCGTDPGPTSVADVNAGAAKRGPKPP